MRPLPPVRSSGNRWPTRLRLVLPGDRPAVADGLMAVVLLVVAFLTRSGGTTAPADAARAPVDTLLLAALFVPLAWRRRYPGAVLLVVGSAAAVVWATQRVDTPTALAGGIAFYGVGHYLDRPRSLRLFAVVGGGLALLAAWLVLEGISPAWAVFFGRCGVIVGAFWFGDAQRSRTALLASLQEQAVRAEQERVEAEHRAVLEERARIARELHDVVAHALSVMVVQSGAASRLLNVDRERASTAIAQVAQVGRSALGEMRRLLGVLDDASPAAGYAPQPHLSEIAAIVERCRTAGLEVTVDQQGSAPLLPAGVELTVVRVVQESLTNVLKHAGPARVSVRLAFGDQVEIDVRDDGAGQQVPTSGGRGLIGMRERVESLGGQWQAGPDPDGGFLVRARIPLAAGESRSAPPSPVEGR